MVDRLVVVFDLLIQQGDLAVDIGNQLLALRDLFIERYKLGKRMFFLVFSFCKQLVGVIDLFLDLFLFIFKVFFGLFLSEGSACAQDEEAQDQKRKTNDFICLYK